MNGFKRTPRSTGAGRLPWLGAVVLGWGLVVSGRADASPIHHVHIAATEHGGMYRSWSMYLMGGPSVWSTVVHPQLSAAIDKELWKSIRTDPPPNPSTVVKFFLFKQSLDPARFDHWHPGIAHALAKIKSELAAAAATTAAATTPPSATSTASPNVQAQTIGPSASSPDANTVPEPSTVLLTIGMAGYAIWCARRRD